VPAKTQKGWPSHDKYLEYHRKYRRANPEQFELARIKYVYGLTDEAARMSMREVRLECHACGSLPTARRKHCIDHEHDTGFIRGVLCHNCNLILGLAYNDAERLRNLIEYLENVIAYKEKRDAGNVS